MLSVFKTIQRYKFLATYFSTVLVTLLPMAEFVVRAQLASVDHLLIFHFLVPL